MNKSNSRKTSFGYRFAMIHRMHATLSRDGMLALGITTAQFPCMAELFHQDSPITQDELSRALNIDPAATARSLEQLEKKGLVRREINPDNRRQKLVSTTSHARAMQDEFFKVLNRASNILVEGLTESEKETALTFLDRIMKNGMEAKYGR